MNNDIILSIIIPVYNVEKYLDECLRSIIKNYNKNIEVILVDDGSKDSSGKICDSYVDKYDFISVIHKENGGLSSARNVGIDNSKGKYIWFVDSDDYISDTSINDILEFAKGNVDLIIGNYTIFYPDGKEIVYQDFKDDTMANILPYDYFNSLGNISHAAVRFIVKKELINTRNLKFMEGIYHEDEQWSPRVLCNAKTFCVIKPSIYNYRVGNATSIMGMVNPKKSYDKLVICKTLYDITNNDIPKGMKEYINSRIVHNYIAVLNEYSNYEEKDKAILLKSIKDNMYLIKKVNDKKAKVVKVLMKLLGIPIVSKLLLLKNSINKE